MNDQDRAMGELKATLGTGGWTRVIVPTVKNKILETLNALAMPGTKNVPDGWTKEEFSSFLSGRVDGLKYVLSTFSGQLDEYERERLSERLAQEDQGSAVGSPYSEAANPQ